MVGMAIIYNYARGSYYWKNAMPENDLAMLQEEFGCVFEVQEAIDAAFNACADNGVNVRTGLSNLQLSWMRNSISTCRPCLDDFVASVGNMSPRACATDIFGGQCEGYVVLPLLQTVSVCAETKYGWNMDASLRTNAHGKHV